MKTGPGFFSTFGSKSKGLLTNDYRSDQKISVSTTSITGLALTSTARNNRYASRGDIQAQYKSNNTSTSVKFDSKSNITTSFTLRNIVLSRNTIASFKLTDSKSGKLNVEYLNRYATLTSTIALNKAPNINVSATIGTPVFAMGAKIAYETSFNKFTNFSFGVNVNTPNSIVSIVLGDKGDTIKGSCIHYFDVLKKTAVAGEITRQLKINKTNFAVGGCYKFDGQTVVKVKVNNCGKISTVLQHESIPKSLVTTLSSELDSKALTKTPNVTTDDAYLLLVFAITTGTRIWKISSPRSSQS